MANKRIVRRQIQSDVTEVQQQPKEPMSDLVKGMLAFSPFFVAVGALATHMYLDRPSHECAAMFFVNVVTFMLGVVVVSP